MVLIEDGAVGSTLVRYVELFLDWFLNSEILCRERVMVAGGCYRNDKIKLEGILLILIIMNGLLGSGPILLIIVAAVGTTIILGSLLRLLGTYSELSKLGRFGLLILLTIGVGFTTFTLTLVPWWGYNLAIAGIIIVCIGFPLLWCRNKK